MPNRSWSAVSEYRFGFQAQEQDNELWGGAVSFKYRIEDPRLGKFFSIDPLTMDYPWNSPYNFSENRVIDAIELEGLESVELNNGNSLSTGSIEPEAQIEKFENSLFNDGNNYITSYGGGKVLEPVVITPNGSEGSLVNFKNNKLNNWEDAPNREPYDGVFGALDYVFNGGQEGSIRYNIKGEPIGPAAIGGAGAAGWIGGPKDPTKIINATKTGVQITEHAVLRMTERGITQKMIETGISKGTKYFDPKSGTFNYVLKNGFASGKDLLIGVSPQTGQVTTVLRGSNLVSKRFIPK
ncbi:MAG: hypothetical protein IPG60_07585 [Bacteroidetes bacterium]|nr:hypothetical protein [Bacteroidota bacterium]